MNRSRSFKVSTGMFAGDVKSFLGDVVVFRSTSKESVFEKLSKIKTPLKFIFEDEIPLLKERLLNIHLRRIGEGLIQIDGIYYKSGDVDKSNQILNLKKEISHLKGEIENIVVEISNLEKAFSELNNVKSEKAKYIEGIENQIREIEKSIGSIDIHLKNNNGIRDNLIKREITIKLVVHEE